MRLHTAGISRTRGLFGRLMMIFFGLVIAIVLSFAVSFHLFYKGEHRALVHKNFKNYANYLANDIGVPPDITIAEQKAKDLGLSIGIFSKDFSYKSSADIPSLDEYDNSVKRSRHRFFKRNHQILIQRSGYTYSFGINKSHVERSIWPLVFSVLLSLLFVMIAYHLVERLFAPLQEIKRAAGEYAQGRFDFSLSKQGPGAMAELSESIREMADKIKSMLDSKSELLLAIAHELRTPITRAKLHLEFLEDSETKQKLSEELNEMSQQITSILEAERLKGGHSQLNTSEVKLDQLVAEVKQQYFRDELRIELDLAKNVELEVDPVKYSLVIKNLLSNAVRYGKDKPVKVILNEQSLSVINFGEAIPQQEIQSIADAFYRVEKGRERQSGGVGLGLYLVKQILLAHGHTLKIESGERTVFKINF